MCSLTFWFINLITRTFKFQFPKWFHAGGLVFVFSWRTLLLFYDQLEIETGKFGFWKPHKHYFIKALAVLILELSVIFIFPPFFPHLSVNDSSIYIFSLKFDGKLLMLKLISLCNPLKFWMHDPKVCNFLISQSNDFFLCHGALLVYLTTK